MKAYQPPKEVVEKIYQYDEFLKQAIGRDFNIKDKNIAIIGEPGAGKTTLLEKIGKYLIDCDGLPIYIPLSNLSELSLKEYILNRWHERQITEEQLQEFLQTKRGWLLLDGLDEMTTASAIEAQNQISQFIAELPGARVVITCRLNVWDVSTKNLLDFQNYKTQEFSHEQVQDFIVRWFERRASQEEATNKKQQEEKGTNLWQKLNESGKERLLDLVKNPLRLALLCEIWDEEDSLTGYLPETQAALYEQFVRYHYQWKESNFSTTFTEQLELNKALGKLAREAINSSKTRFRIRQKFAREVMGEKLLKRALQLGWLNQVDRDKQTKEPFYAFYHATFQEYFAALAIDDWDFFLPRNHKNRPIKDKRYRIFEPQWKQVILLWLGRDDVKLEEKKEEFIQALIKFKDGCGDFYYYRVYFLAAAGIAEFRNCSKSDEIIEQIVEWYETKQEVENEAEKALFKINREKAIAALIDLTRNASDEYIRMQAAESLGKIDPGNQEAIAALIDLIGNASDESIRERAAYSLGKIGVGNREAIFCLSSLTRNARDEEVRRQAAESLHKIDRGNREASAALIDLARNILARNISDESIRRELEARVFFLERILKVYDEKRDKFIRMQAAESLEEIGAGDQDAISVLIDLTRNASDEVIHKGAAELLGQFGAGNQEAISCLSSLTRNARDEEVRRQAAESLRKIDPGNQEAISCLSSLTRNARDEEVRRQAAESLRKIDPGNQEAIATLIDLIRNASKEYIRRRAAMSLEKVGVGNQEAIAALINLTRNASNISTRRLAAYSLWKIDPGNQEAIAALVKLSRNLFDSDLREKATESLKKILISEQMPKVVTQLKTSSTLFPSNYEVVLYCAQSLTYPDFYRAWHARLW